MLCDSLFSLCFQLPKPEKEYKAEENLVINAYLPKSGIG